MSLIQDTIHGALLGAGVGAALCGMSSAIKRRQSLVKTVGDDIGVDCTWLKADAQLCELVWRFKEIEKHGPQLFRSIVTNCDALVKIVHDDKRPTRQIHANRALVAARSAALALCRLALSNCDSNAVALNTDIPELESLCNNHLHNVMVDS